MGSARVRAFKDASPEAAEERDILFPVEPVPAIAPLVIEQREKRAKRLSMLESMMRCCG
jgi:hypothetical protein